MTKYNGHKNWTQWNVCLWINNDESLYHMARNYILFKQRSYNKEQCAEAMLNELHSMGLPTPQTELNIAKQLSAPP